MAVAAIPMGGAVATESEAFTGPRAVLEGRFRIKQA